MDFLSQKLFTEIQILL